MKKIALIIPMLQPYRITFYERIVESNPNIRFNFFHGLTRESARPAYKDEVKFDTIPYYPKLIKVGPFGLYFNEGLLEKIKEFNPHAIILFGNPGVITNQEIVRWAKRKKIKVALWVCSWDNGKAKGIFKPIKDYITKLYFNKADYFLAYSSHAKKFIEDLTGKADNITIAYNGLDISGQLQNYNNVLSEAQVLRNNLPPKSFLFLYVGGIIPTKKPIFLINAFIKLHKQNPNIYLWIIGSGPEKEKIEELIKQYPNIQFWGRIVDGVDKYFAAADCFVLPGSGGLALNQAMFWKTPCIASFADGTEEDLVIDGQTGFRFEVKNEQNLIEKMNHILKMPESEREIYGENAYKLIVNQSNTEKMTKAFNVVIKKLVQ